MDEVMQHQYFLGMAIVNVKKIYFNNLNFIL
jgi:hypothetical protein